MPENRMCHGLDRRRFPGNMPRRNPHDDWHQHRTCPQDSDAKIEIAPSHQARSVCVQGHYRPHRHSRPVLKLRRREERARRTPAHPCHHRARRESRPLSPPQGQAVVRRIPSGHPPYSNESGRPPFHRYVCTLWPARHDPSTRSHAQQAGRNAVFGDSSRVQLDHVMPYKKGNRLFDLKRVYCDVRDRQLPAENRLIGHKAVDTTHK